jgi:hypothetical protein
MEDSFSKDNLPSSRSLIKVKCTMRNWNTEFKPEFQNAALLYGAAGEMIFHDSYTYAIEKPLDFNATERSHISRRR